MPEVPGVWTETYRVRTYETDPQGRASIQTLCNYFQEAAGNHALAYGVPIEALLARDLTWVLARLHVQIDAYPQQGETVRVETWPVAFVGIYAYRHFLVYRMDEDGQASQCLGRGASAWLVVDMQRMRPIRIPPPISEIVPPERPPAIAGDFDRLKPPDGAEHERRFRVRYSDLDVNRHVNNVCYAEWAVETVPEAVLHTCQLSAIELQFRAETTLGDTVVAQARQQSDGEVLRFDHRLLREADEREVALARTRWRAPGA